MTELALMKVIHQVSSLQDFRVTHEVNAYLMYGWTLIAIVDWASADDGGIACPIFVLGHTDPEALQPSQDPLSKKWE